MIEFQKHSQFQAEKLIEKYFCKKYGKNKEIREPHPISKYMNYKKQIKDFKEDFDYVKIIKELNEVKNYNKEELLFTLTIFHMKFQLDFDSMKRFQIALGLYPKSFQGIKRVQSKHIDFKIYNSAFKKLDELKILIDFCDKNSNKKKDKEDKKEKKTKKEDKDSEDEKNKSLTKRKFGINSKFIMMMLSECFHKIDFSSIFYNNLFNKRDELIIRDLDKTNKIDEEIQKINFITTMEIGKIEKYNQILSNQKIIMDNFNALLNKFDNKYSYSRIVRIIEYVYSNYVNYIYINQLRRKFEKEDEINYLKTFSYYLEEVGNEWILFKNIFMYHKKYVKNNKNPFEILIEEIDIDEISQYSLKKRLDKNNNKIADSEIDVLRCFNINNINNHFAKEFPLIRLLIGDTIELDTNSWYYENDSFVQILDFLDLCELYFKLNNYDKLKIGNKI